MEKSFIFSFHFMMKLLEKVALKKKVMLVTLDKILSSLLEETNTPVLAYVENKEFLSVPKTNKKNDVQSSLTVWPFE